MQIDQADQAAPVRVGNKNRKRSTRVRNRKFRCKTTF
jgi:hypothetical protein